MRISLIVRRLAHDQKIQVRFLYPRIYILKVWIIISLYSYPSAGMVDSASLSFVG